MRLAPVDDGRALHPVAHRLQAGAHLGDHAAGQGREDLLQRLGADLADDLLGVRPVEVEALDVGEDEELLGTERGCQRGRGGVGVDVVDDTVDVGRDAGHDRDPARLDQVEDRLRPHLGDLADQAEVDLLAVDDGAGLLGGEQARVLAGQADGERAVLVDQPDQLALDLADQHHPHDVHRLGRGDSQAAAELRLDAEPVEHLRDLRAAAVDDDRAEAGEAQEGDVLGERALEVLVGHGVAAVLNDDDLAVVGLQPGQRPGQRGRLVGVGLAGLVHLGLDLGHEL